MSVLHPSANDRRAMTVVKNLLRLVLTSGSALFLFLLLVLAGRVLGPQDFGRFSLALAVAVVLDPLLDPGLYHLLVREVARDRAAAARYLYHVLGWKAVLAPPLILGIRFLVPHIDASPATLSAVTLVAASQVLKSMKDAIGATLSADDRFARGFVSLGAERILLLVAGAFVMQVGGGLLGLCEAFLAVRLFDLFFAWLLVRGPLGKPAVSPEPRFLGRLLRLGAPAAVFYVASSLYGYLDTFMLAAMRTETDVGHYNAAYRLFEGIAVAALMGSGVLLPRLERHQREAPDAFQTVFGSGLKYAWGFGALAGGNAVLLAPVVIRFFFGGGYEPSISSLRLLVTAFPAVFVINFANAALLAGGRWRIAVGLTALGAALNGALNLRLIPLYSHDGAAAATAVSAAVHFGAVFVLVRRDAPGVARHVFGTISVAAAAATLAVWLTAAGGVLLQLAAGNGVFLAVVLFGGFVSGSERKALLDAMRIPVRRSLPAA